MNPGATYIASLIGFNLPPRLALFLTLAFIVFLFWRDIRERANVTRALWIPTFGPSPCIRRGRDIINNGTTPKPGYKPYTYLHPLVSGVSVASRKTAEDREQTADTSSSSK